MFLKKSLLIGSALAILGLPVLAVATPVLYTHNNTDEASTVRILSTGKCSSQPPYFKVTQPHTTLPTTLLAVRFICNNKSTGSCEANVFATDSCGEDKDSLGTLSIDLTTLEVTPNHLEKTINNKKYVITASGTDVWIDYKK